MLALIPAHNGQFVQYNPIHDYRMILDFIRNSKVYSNLTNFKNLTEQLIAYEMKRKFGKVKKKVYAVELLLMLPKHLSKSQRHEVVKNYMLELSLKYKDILYIYSFEHIGKGLYCRVVVFERQIYKRKHKEAIIYKRDMYINKITGRTTNSDDEEAVHICKKGEIKKDENGNELYEFVAISPKKYRYLNFKDDSDNEKKKEKFVRFKDKLTRLLVIALSKVLSTSVMIKKLRYSAYKKDSFRSNKKIYYNSMINRLNIELQLMQEFFRYRKAFEDENEAMNNFNHVFYSLVHKLDIGELNLKNLKIIINPECKLSFDRFKENIDTFERIAMNRIKKWYYNEFYDPELDNAVKEYMKYRVI